MVDTYSQLTIQQKLGENLKYDYIGLLRKKTYILLLFLTHPTQTAADKAPAKTTHPKTTTATSNAERRLL